MTKPVGRAKARYVRIAPRKVRMVTDLIRGRSVTQALSLLRFTLKGASPIVEKALRSAVANATVGGDVDVDNLVVRTIEVGPGPTMRRWRAATRGPAPRARRSSHVRIELAEV